MRMPNILRYMMRPVKMDEIMEEIKGETHCIKDPCPICMRVKFRKIAITDCNHVFCISCINKYNSEDLHRSVPQGCPLCRHQFQNIKVYKTIRLPL